MHTAFTALCRALRTHRPWQGLVKLGSLGLLVGGMVWVAAQSQITTPMGSYLELGGQVVAPANSPTLHSTLDISGKDQVRWTSYFQSKLDGPHETEGVLDIPAGHTWVAGSVRKPANASLQWLVNGQWQGSEPAGGSAVTQVKWKISPPSVFSATVSSDTSAYLWHLGDAFRLIPYKNYMFVSMRDATVPPGGNYGSLRSGYFKCRAAFGFMPQPNQPCVLPANPAQGTAARTLPMEGMSFGAKVGDPVDTDSGTTWRSSSVPLEIVNYDTGEMFMGMQKADGSGNYVVCTNLDTLKHCGQWQVSDGRALGAAPIINLASVGHKYFMLVDGLDTVVCFDSVARAECGRQRYPDAYSNEYTIATNSLALGGKLFMLNHRSGQVYCHDAATNAPCAGWTASGRSMALPIYSGLYPFLNPDGSPKGVCNSGMRCVSLDGAAFNPPQNYRNIYVQEMNYVHHTDAIIGTRLFTRYGPIVRCYDFANDDSCGFTTLPQWAYHPDFPGQSYGMLHTYTSRLDPNRPNCLLMVGSNGQADLVDANSMRAFTDYSPNQPCRGASSSKLPDVDVSPAVALQCDGSRSKVLAWDKVRLSTSLPWGGNNGLSGVTVTLKDANGTPLPDRFNPVRQMTYGTHQLDISDVPYADFPQLKVSFTLASPQGLQANGKAGADVTWKGDPLQVCVSTQAPAAPDCQTQAALQVTHTLLGSSITETLQVSKVMSPGGLSSGYSAVATPSSQRAVLTDKGPRDPKTAVLQGRWALQDFSGDLWAFGLTPEGQIDGSSYRSAQAATAAPEARPMFTAAEAANGVQPVQALSWGSLTAGQQAALNTNMSGLPDTLGAARLAYLRGADGSFRPRGGNRLGPVINSSPAMLLPAATLSLSERHHPGYTAYRSTVTRPYPIALYGGNDGALHAYEVRSGGLREAWAFVPNVMLGRAAHYADASMAALRASPYFVDNIPMVGHVNTTGTPEGWRAVAVLTYGRGARAITALDVTAADLSQGQGVLFEYSNVSDPELKDLGYIISQPVANNAMVSQQMVQLAEGAGQRAAVLVGNGINSHDGAGGAAASGTGKAVLYAFYLDRNGARRWQRWAVDELWAGAASEPGLRVNNGLSTPTPVDADGDGRVDVVYAGDLQGNLWRFDVRDPAAARVTRLFKTEAQQPITQAPFVTMNTQASGCGSAEADAPAAARRCWQVVFATGAAISPLQGSANVATQAVYGVLDKGTGATVQRGQLTALPYALNQVVQGVEYRALTPTTVNYKAGRMGWVMDLQDFEHGVGAPRLQPTGLVMFSSVRPVTPDRAVNVCIGPRSWLNELDPINGYSPLVPFDLNGDGRIDGQDRLNPSSEQPLSPAGMAVSGGQFGPPAVLQAASTQAQQMSLLLPSLGQDTGQANSWSGGAGAGGGSSPAPGSNSTALTHANPAKLGRMTWREVY